MAVQALSVEIVLDVRSCPLALLVMGVRQMILHWWALHGDSMPTSRRTRSRTFHEPSW